MSDGLLNSENGRFGRFGMHAKPSAPQSRRFGRLWTDSRFHLQNSENPNLLALLQWLSVTLLVDGKHQTCLRVCQLKTSFLPASI